MNWTSLTSVFILVLFVSQIVIFAVIPRLNDSPEGKTTTVLLGVNVLFLLYLLACVYWDSVLWSPSAYFWGLVCLVETFVVTPLFTLFNASVLFGRRLRDCAPIAFVLIVVNLLLSVFVLYTVVAIY